MEVVLIVLVLVVIIGGMFLLSQYFNIWRERRLKEWSSDQKYTTIRIDVPKNNEKAPLAAEQMFASIHGVYSESAVYQDRISFEIVAKDKYIQFYIHVPTHLKDFVEGQVYAQYPTVEINEVNDYVKPKSDKAMSFAGVELTTTKEDVYPIKLFSDFEVDPISGITSVMSKLNPNEEVWMQTIITPVGDEWQDKGNRLINMIKSGKSNGTAGFIQSTSLFLSKAFKMIAVQAIRPGSEVTEEKKDTEIPGTVQEALKGIEYKVMKLGFLTKIRILAISPNETSARVKAQSLAAAFKQYNTTNANGFRVKSLEINNDNFYKSYLNREFVDSGSIFNISELASIYHFPHQTVSTPNIVWAGAKKGEPPANLPLQENTPPKDFTTIGETTFRNTFRLFGIKRDDRRRHIYVIGKSGVGKSVLLENMAITDVYKGDGVIIVDPHGEFAEKVLACIPAERKEDVVIFDPADRAYPIAFNLLENVEDDFKGMVASGFVGIFKKIFGHSWGPRLEHILRNTVLALLDFKDSTMLDIPRMLTEDHFRDKVVEQVKDSVIKEFWTTEFAQYDSKFRTEAVSPILNKVGQFLATATIRNIVGQPKSVLDIREIMDQQKIMIVNLSRGKIGEDNSALLGAMMITKIQLAAMSRADVTVTNRPDCYLYVDEFQNFATESFAVILSEARKYNLNLTVANQYITQMPEEVRDAVFGNAGTIISFRVGGGDAQFLVREFEPVFDANDLVNLDKYNIYIKLLIDGISSPAFSARTLPPVDKISGIADEIIKLSRQRYSKPRAVVEDAIDRRAKEEIEEAKAEAEAFKKGGLEALLTLKKDKGENINRFNKPATKNKEESTAKADKDSKAVPKDDEKSAGIKAASDNATIDDKINSDENTMKKRIFRYENLINDKLYKEQTARGGIKWYVGEKVDLDEMKESGVEVDDKGKKMLELARKAGDTIDYKKNKKIHHEYKRDKDDKNNPDQKVGVGSGEVREGEAVKL